MGRARWLACMAALLWLGCTTAPARGACPARAVLGCACGKGGARLDCRSAALRRLPPLHDNLLSLDVSNNNISTLPRDALLPAVTLRELKLSMNRLESVPDGALSGAAQLEQLWLDQCALRHLPTHALYDLHHLQFLSLAGNLISELTALPPLPALHTLVLKRNRIAFIDEHAFSNTPALRVLSLASNRVEVLKPGVLQVCRRLESLELGANPLAHVHAHALSHLPHLTTLVLSEARSLRALPSLNGTARLRTLHVDRARLASLPPDLCAHAPMLRSLDVKLNVLHRVPELHDCAELRVLDLSGNEITSLEGGALRGLRRLHDLLLARNRLRRLPADTFTHTPNLQALNLEDNLIEHIDTETFVPLSKLENLNVGNNVFPWLPGAGLQHLLHLKAHNNPNLRHFHPHDMLPRIQTLVVSYAYHCCEFMPLMEEADKVPTAESPSDLVILPPQHINAATWANTTDIWKQYLNVSELGSADVAGLQTMLEGWVAAGAVVLGESELRADAPRKVQCLPLPGPFLPCVDLFDWWTLRCGVWVMFLLALLGNGTVFFVHIFNRSRIDVPRFLITNLAAADIFMSIYLGFLAVVDAGTLGEFRAHAIAWQMSGSCKLAGFLGVLSFEMSMFTLAVITIERNYAITHTMQINKRLSLRHVAGVMAAGWAFSLAVAALPLLGVSDYRKFALCLPLETSTPVGLGYVVALLLIHGVAFLVLLVCYLKMCCAIHGSQAWKSNDFRITKHMAVLLFTGFMSWSPIIFFGLTAAFGVQLLSLEGAKVLTVFVLPLNSCCNPFLYAFLTKQFKKDCKLVCKAIEASRVTHGIGRCHHSSKFSNSQTPVNTNSLAECSSPGSSAGADDAERELQRVDSVSSPVEFSSSRSDSWCTYDQPTSPSPLRRAASWLVARKTSKDSNLSSSRNDSSGSNAIAFSDTWRTSRSDGSATGAEGARHPAVDEGPGSLAPRHLYTIPSAAKAELKPDEDLLAIVQDSAPSTDPPPPLTHTHTQMNE